MTWEEFNYSQLEVKKAGRVLRGEDISGMTEEVALKILDNWRAIHSYPLQVFYVRLRTTSKKLDPSSLTAQRLKRASSIIAKLQRRYYGRNPSMELTQMQDIAGCRAILSSVTLARRFVEEEYIKKKGDLKHKLVGMKDYITSPKPDGYRSIHLIYSYKSDKKNKKKYDGLLVEIQIRSKLQHIWATAVETVDFFTRQAMKSNEGQPDWLEFFRLVSSAFAKIEDCPAVPDTPSVDKELYSQILQKERKLNVTNKIRGWTRAMKIFDERLRKKGANLFLLELDILGEKLTIHSYTRKEEGKALKEYAALEKRYSSSKEYDVVLAGVNAEHDLKKAYPNYFVDTSEFLRQLGKIIRIANSIEAVGLGQGGFRHENGGGAAESE